MDRNLQVLMVAYLRRKARDCGMHLDTYDPDAIMSIIQEFLKENDAALTGTGVRRFRR